MPLEKSAGTVVFYKNPNGKIEYLLLKHRAGNWNFPKGLIEKGEGLKETAMRECWEETGLGETELIPEFKETIRFFFRVKYDYQLERGFKIGQNILKFVTYFLVQSKTKNVKISFEHEDYKWLSFEEAMKMLKKYKNSQEVLKKARQFLIKKDL